MLQPSKQHLFFNILMITSCIRYCSFWLLLMGKQNPKPLLLQISFGKI